MILMITKEVNRTVLSVNSHSSHLQLMQGRYAGHVAATPSDLDTLLRATKKNSFVRVRKIILLCIWCFISTVFTFLKNGIHTTVLHNVSVFPTNLQLLAYIVNVNTFPTSLHTMLK